MLKVGGTYIAISYGNPEGREFHLIRDHLSFNVLTFKIEKISNKVHHVFICTKREDADKKCKENYSKVLEIIKIEMEKEEAEASRQK